VRPHVEALIGYAKTVVAKKIPAGKYVRLACKRHLDDLKRSKKKNYPYYFDEAAAERICAFAELLPHVKGKWARDKELIRLRPWQSFVFGVPFGWKRKSDGLRRFREIYDEIPRKNGKSVIGAVTGLYMFACDNEFGAEVYSGATTEKQAWEVFRPAKQMLERAEDIRNDFGAEVWAKSLVRIADESRFEPIIGNPGDGASPSCTVIDEYHEHDTPNLYDTMTTGMGAREQPMNVIITTAGDNIAGPCYNKHLEVRRVLEGVIENDELFGIIYSIDEKDDPFDPKVLPKANPNYDVSVFGDFLQAKQRQAVINTHEQAKFKTKHLNVWLQARAGLINLKQWQMAGDAMLKIEELQGEECWFILDLAQKSDLCAFVQLFRKRLNGFDHWYCFAKHYLPEKTLEEGTSNQAAYRKWMIEGHLTVTEGATVDYETIKEDVVEFAKRFNPKEIIYDPYNATHLAQRIHAEVAESIVLVEYPQTPQNMAVPMDEINTALKDARLHHDANPLLAWEAANTVGRPAKKGLLVPSKEKPEQKIDGIVALVMGFGRAVVPGKGPSVYEERGLVIL
jgi:phage terminase large subunit-like protein